MPNTPHLSKAFYEDIAELANGPDAARIGKLLQSLEPGAGGPAASGGPPPGGPGGPGAPMGGPSSGPEPIGQWMPQQVDGQLAFVRPERLVLLNPWGTTQRVFQAQKDPRHTRVVYLGESAATGLHYAPDYSFGRIIEAQLHAAAGPGVFDFVDLSMAGLIPPVLLEQFRASLQLDPDVVLIMVGNNWRAMMPWDRLSEARALREGGYPQLMKERLALVRGAADMTMRGLAELAQGRKTRVIIVVPENNMVDHAHSHPVAWLPGDGSQRWHGLHQRAREQLAARAYEAVAELARQMGELDGGTCSTTHRLRALALMGLGRPQEAREAFHAEMECAIGNRFIIEIPRIGPQIQEALREGARAAGFACVDLPAVLAAGGGAPLPGRETFYDYCHFTVEAMRRVAATMVLEVCKVAGKAPAPGTGVASLVKAAPELLATTDAAAKMGATLGNAMISHELEEVAEHWCEQAVKASSGILQQMVEHVGMVTGSTPAVLTRAFQQLRQLPYKKVFYEFPSGIALETIAKVAARAEPRAHQRLLEILQENLGLTERPLDLSQYLHALSWNERFMEDFEFGLRGDERLPYNKGPLHRSPWPTSQFFAVHDGQRDVVLELTARLPAVGGQRAGAVGISVNLQPVGEGTAGTKWSKHSFRVPAQAWRAGPNRVAIHWPALPPHGEAALREVAARWEEGTGALPFPIFGEVFSLNARTA